MIKKTLGTNTKRNKKTVQQFRRKKEQKVIIGRKMTVDNVKIKNLESSKNRHKYPFNVNKMRGK